MNRFVTSSARARATFALVLALTCVLSFALLSGTALAAAGVVSVVASVLAIGYALGTSRRRGQRAVYSEASPVRS